MIPGSRLRELVDRALEELAKEGISAEESRELANGTRIVFSDGKSSCGINFYYSSRKGFSVVPAGGDAHLAGRVREILLQDVPRLPSGEWTGSDEAGKGDYMGPLTVAAVGADRGLAAEFAGMGIQDSKNLGNAVLRGMAGRVRDMASGRCNVVTVTPLEYNTRLEELRKKGLNSLDLLALCHAAALSGLLERIPEPDVVIIDKFCDEKRISHLLPQGRYMLQLRERGESDPAVAAASILARDAYLQGLDRIGEEYGIPAVSGSGRPTDIVARRFADRFGPEVLYRVAKVHFRNTSRVLSLFG